MPVDAFRTERLSYLVLAATLCSAFALIGVLAFDSSPTRACVMWLVLGTICVAGHVGLRRVFADREPTVSPLIVLSALLPMVWQVGSRLSSGTGFPGEVLMILIAQAIGCGLAVVSFWRPHQPLALVCGLFVVLFSTSMGTKWWSVAGAAGYTLAASMWLASQHWSALERRMKPADRVPPRLSRLLPVALTLVLLLAFAGARFESLRGLVGFVSSSGGDRGADPSARQGVGEGDALVAGTDQIQTFGPIEDAPFVSGKEPSLYDVFNELYDEPVRNAQSDRSIALTTEQLKELKNRMAKSEQASRDFSVVRKPRGSSVRPVRSLASTALFYVKGRVPLHLRHEVYDLFDGTAWHAVDDLAEETRPKLHPRLVANHTWMFLPGVVSRDRLQGPIENHAVKFVHLKSNRLPSPLDLVAVHIRELNDPEMFRYVGENRLQIARESIPALTPIHFKSRTVRLSEVDAYTGATRPPLPASMELPASSEMAKLKPLAEAWTADAPRGVRQVMRVIEHLKTEYRLAPVDETESLSRDRNVGSQKLAASDVSAAAASSDTTVSKFLFETRRGRDYEFATAAALLLRTLGYPTRLVAGFYASPENFDHAKQHTPVYGRDAHVWLEVQVGLGLWITVDPTPGYEVLTPPLTTWETVLATLANAGQRLWTLRVWLFVGACAGGGLWLSRRSWLDWLTVWVWRLAVVRSVRGRILQTVRLIDRRLALRGWHRPFVCSPRVWYARLPLDDRDRAALRTVAQLADWAAFAPESHAPPLTSRDIAPRLVEAFQAVGRLNSNRPHSPWPVHDRVEERSQSPLPSPV